MPPLTLAEKIDILTAGARYDASCSSSGSTRPNSGGLGSAARSGICHSWSADGRCISLLKLLLTNICVYDCAYCVNRRSNDVPRAILTPAEVADLTVQFYRRNYIEGLFLSTGVVRSADYTMELLLAVARTLREEHRFQGYLHIKLTPGADPELVRRISRFADRVSVNIELPTERSLALVAPEKSREAILRPMREVHEGITVARAEGKKSRKAPSFAPAGQSTQLIVGASPEDDRQILRLAAGLYRQMELKRVYYSAFVPVSPDNRLPAVQEPPLRREHRLYQADWLLRFYGFSVEEIVDEEHPHLDPLLDPKAAWAIRHLESFPVEVRTADYESLLRVPGVGVRSARRILRARRAAPLAWDDLARLGVVMKRARYFITVGGRSAKEGSVRPTQIRQFLLEGPSQRGGEQLSLFAPVDSTSITGEL